MSKHLQKDLDSIKKKILIMGSLVESAMDKSIHALNNRLPDMSQKVIDGDSDIDAMENEIEEDCLKALALHQPVAEDLRFIVTVMKVNNDLERMGDLALNIAERAAYLSVHDRIPVPLNFTKMMEKVQGMVRHSLKALVELNTKLARGVCESDDEVDAMNKEMFVVLQDLMYKDRETIKCAVHTLSVSRHLERIADLATNIAEDVIFMVEGDIVRHRHEDYNKEDRSVFS